MLIEAIKTIRQLKKLKIKDMTLGKSRFAYSRIEKGETKCNLNDFESIIDKLEITPLELVTFSEYDNDYENYKRLLNECIEQPKNSLKTNELLRKYYEPKNLNQKTKLEILFLVGIVGNFAKKIDKVKPFSTTECTTIFNRIINQHYFTEYDYHIVLNLMTVISEDMLDQLIGKMYPVEYSNKRTKNLIRYSSFILTNAVSLLIYNKKYKKALYYTELLEKNIPVTENYYLHLNMMYHKNIALFFDKNDTIYIENSRKIIRMIYDIGDIVLANTLEEELNNLTKNPGYYSDYSKFARITPRG